MRKIHKLASIFTAALLAASFTIAAPAEDVIYRTLDEIRESGTINIGVFSDKNPFGYVDENGDYQGYDVYFANRIGEDLGVDIEFVSTEAANRVEYLETGKVDIILANFTVTEERAQKVDFALPYMNVALGVVSPDSRVIETLDELEPDDEVIVISGTTAETYLIENYPEITLQKYDTYANAKNALENGNAAAWANDNTEVIAYSLQNPGYTVGIPSLGSQDTIAPAVSKGNETLLNWINEEIKSLAEEEFFHKDYEETLADTYGLDYEESLVVEGGVPVAAADETEAEAADKTEAEAEKETGSEPWFQVEVNAEIPSPENDDNTITFGVVPTPHGEVAEAIEEKLSEAGWELDIVTYEDYVQPNNALEAGDLDANYFQHYPYLADFNEQNGTELSAVAAVHFEPLGIYSGKTGSLNEIQDGAVIAVPNDTTNEARALQLLEANGLIRLEEGVGLQATVLSIEENPYNIEILEMEAAQTPRVIDEVDFAVVNGNYAIDADIRDRLLANEDAASDAALTYANLIVVKAGEEESLKTKALTAAIISDDIRTFINETYDGAVVAVF